MTEKKATHNKRICKNRGWTEYQSAVHRYQVRFQQTEINRQQL